MNIERLLSDKEWLVERNSYNKNEHSFYETLYTLSNGYFGIRSTIEFDSLYSFPGCYFINVYDRGIAVNSKISNAPNFLDMKLIIGDVPVNFDEVNILSFYHILDMRKSFVYTLLKFKDMNNRITKIEYVTLIHGKFFNLGIILGNIKPENYADNIYIKFSINYGIGNIYLWGLCPYIRIYHWEPSKMKYDKENLYSEFNSVFKNQSIGYASKILANNDFKFVSRERYKISEYIEIDAKRGETYNFMKYVTFFTSKNSNDIEKDCRELLKKISIFDINKLLEWHFKIWKKRWGLCDILIDGDALAQKSIRFSIYHLLQTYNKDWGQSIPARGLTSDYHSGHYFFNTELFMLFFYLFNFPDKVKTILKFRYKTLKAAKEFAKTTGFKGARYPEEADELGRPDSPFKVKDFSSGKEFQEWSGKEVYHISADVSYSIYKYFECTYDYEFILKCGLEMLIEIARFYFSLVQWNYEKKKYVIRGVMGPDEFHYHIDNNYFTNYMAKWSINYCLYMIYLLKVYNLEKTEKIIGKTALTDDEINTWQNIAERIYIPLPDKNGIIEQYEGYFMLPDGTTIKNYNAKGRPLLPKEYKEEAKYLSIILTRIIKQADVIFLFYLFRNLVDLKTKKANYDFYERRTVHESSLSEPCYGLIAADIGEIDKAYQYFIRTLRYNLDYTPKNNYLNGLHLGAYGGAYRILVEGFGGLKILKENIIEITPRLPRNWKRLIFNIKLFGNLIKLEITCTTIRINLMKKAKKCTHFKIRVDDNEVDIANSNDLIIPYEGK